MFLILYIQLAISLPVSGLFSTSGLVLLFFEGGLANTDSSTPCVGYTESTRVISYYGSDLGILQGEGLIRPQQVL